MRQNILLVGLVCILIIFSSMGLGWSQENNLPLEDRIEQLEEELDEMYSLLEEEKREYIRQHPIKVDIEIEPNVMWELTKEAEGEESNQYLAKFIKSFPNDPRVRDAMWYMMSMAYFNKHYAFREKGVEIEIDPFIPLKEYAERFPNDGANTAFARGCLHYERVNFWFWTYSASELKRKKLELIEESRNEVLEGIEFFKEAIDLAKSGQEFREFKSPHAQWKGGGYLAWGEIRESAYWNIGEGYERLEMLEKAIETYSFYLLEYPESDEADTAKAKIYLMRQELGQSE